MTVPEPGREGRRWLRQAEADLDAARYLRDGGRHYAACFFAQQAGEKAVKAVLFARGAQTVWGHSIADLLDELLPSDPDLAKLKPAVAPLDVFYVPTRYPDSLPGGTPSDVHGPEQSRSAVEMAETLVQAVAARLRPGP